MVRGYLLNINELEKINYDEKTFSKRRLDKIENIKFEREKKCMIAAELLLIHALKQLDENLELPLLIGEEKGGKPELESKINLSDENKKLFENEKVYFNISHSEEYAICVVSNKPIGVDIEYVKRKVMPDPEKILHPSEVGTLAFITNPLEKKKYFFECWTLKECYVKNLGIGLTIKTKEFKVDEKGVEGIGKKLKYRYAHNMQPGEIKNTDWKFDVNYKVSVCTPEKDEDMVIAELKAENI